MATACTYCGQDLPKDDAHFCNHCGMLVPSHPFSAQSLATASPAVPPQEQEKPVLREQMVHRSVHKPIAQEQVPQLPRPRTTRRIAPDNLAASSIAWPAPITHVSVKDTSTLKDNAPVVPQEQQVQNPVPKPVVPERELRVKVWEQELTNPPTPIPESKLEEEHNEIEDAPTAPLEVSEQTKIGNPPSQNGTDSDDIANLDTISTPNNHVSISQLDTISTSNNHAPMSQQAPRSAQSMRGNTPLPIEQPQQGKQVYTNTPIPYSSISPQPVRTVQPSQYSSAKLAQSSIQEKRTSVVSPITPPTTRHQKSRVPFIILLALLGVLVLGIGAWVVLTQPFSISPVTQPLQGFKDTRLGVSLSYPNSWSVQHNATGVLFSDSSHTAQVKLNVTDDTSDAAQYVLQQAKKNGMTAIKPLGILSFAGASWQQVQGNMQQDGANYTTTMLATMRGNHMYTLTQMAPQNVYSDEDSVVFSAIRRSFTFL